MTLRNLDDDAALTRNHLLARRIVRSLVREATATFALLAGLLVLLSLLLSAGMGSQQQLGVGWWQRLLHFLGCVHLDRNGTLIWPALLAACRQTLPLVGVASLWLTVLSVAAGITFALYPRMQIGRWVIVGMSCLPSFMWPLLSFLLTPDRPFASLAQLANWGWPALCLAIGDLNWLTGSTVITVAVRQELGRPHLRLSRALGTPIVLDLVPRLLVTILGFLAARLPHLLGGTLALEALFRLRGLGLWTWNAVVESPPDPAVLFWVGALGIVLSRLMHAATTLTSLVCFPNLHLSELNFAAGIEIDEPVEGTAIDVNVNSIEPTDSGAISNSPTGSKEPSVQLVLPVDAIPPRPSLWQAIAVRWRYYRELHPIHCVQIRISWALISLWTGLMLILAGHAAWVKMQLVKSLRPAFEAPSFTFPFGTNAAGDDVALLLWRGWWQQIPAWIGCVLTVWLAIPLVLLGLLSAARQARWLRISLLAIQALVEGLTALLEATPKLVWLLACVTIFTLDGLVVKLALAMGILFVPQLLRSLQHDLAVIKSSVFLEAMRMARVPWTRILMQNVLTAHVWPVLSVQTALILSNVLLTEAWLGYMGVRNRGEIFTWGSVLGMGVDEFVQMRPLIAFGQPFNDGVVWGPMLCLWLTICVLTTLGHAATILTGNSLWQRRS